MVCTANDLQRWKDFPKGLRVLLLERDSNSATEVRVKLEAMDYKVFTFYDENEALSAISSTPEGFHVAIVEVSTSSSEGCFKFLENAKDLPTIMTSNIQCLSTMMKCIALGAVEFLSKPLSEDKLRHIWQHVVHKAFNAGSESLKPVKESVESMLQLQTDNGNLETKISIDTENVSQFSDNNDHEQNAGNDKYPAPSTPQLKQVSRLLDDGDCQEQITNCSTEKEGGEHDDGESKSVETSCENILNAESTPNPQNSEKTMMIKEQEEDDGYKGETTENAVSLNPHDRTCISNANDNTTTPPEKAGAVLSDSCEVTKANRKKMKVDWTPDLHKKFVQAVEQLGVDHAIPSRILELMKVEGLTRHNVASHLQKYRMHKRQIVPREVDRRCQNQRDQMQKSYCLQRPVMAYPPPYHSNHTPLSHPAPPPPIYPPMWRQSGSQTAGVQIWSPPGYPPLWQPAETWHWNAFPGMHHVDAWGCPVFPPPQAPCFSYPQNMAAGLHNAKAVDYKFGMPPSSFDQYPAEEVVDKIVKEAMSKPWLPLPLGLKPPSTDSVLAELSKKGLSTTTPLTRLATTKDSKPR